MRLICYTTSGRPPQLAPAPVERTWMDRTPDGFAYRCLPLNIANAHGWLILNEAPFVAEWSGGVDPATIKIRRTETLAGETMMGLSHFGSGVLTFQIAGLFRTEPGWDLWVGGPMNRVKDGIQPLVGIVETDWSPFSFTMNWLFTRADTPVMFERGEPICMIFPVPRGAIEDTLPEIRSLESDPEVKAAFTRWSESRNKFNADLKVAGSPAQQQKWQKDYFRGGNTGFGTAPPDHRTKVKVSPFREVSDAEAADAPMPSPTDG